MFKTPQSRYLLRSSLAAILAMVSVAATVWVDNPYLKVAGAGALALSGYLGIGAATPQVEPFVGNKMDDAQVPIPPADPVSPESL